ncbi:MAG: phosphatase PAP2 family protein [Microthrixaceae bacterium]
MHLRRTLSERIAGADGDLARRIVARQSSAAAVVLPRLSNTANHSGIWMALAGASAIFGGRSGRRAAQRGVMSVGIASLIASGILKPLFPRERPPVSPGALPSSVRRPKSSSFPSGHTASAAAFATAVAMEAPAISIPVWPIAAGVAYSRITTGVHYPSDVLAGAAIGVAAAAVTTKIWPRIDPTPATARRSPTRLTIEPSPEGDGLTLVVNASSGPASYEADLNAIQSALPKVDAVLVEDPTILDSKLAEAAKTSVALGVLGGDGTVGAGAAAALENEIPLVVFPGGTLNHFARDLGVDNLDEAISAVAEGQLVEVDISTIDDRPFLNTASLGSYSDFVDARERYESQIGKWPAAIIALAKVLMNGKPLQVELNGSRQTIWMIFIGNCAYDPPGFVPSTRNRLDDGQLDVRYVDGAAPFARLRLITAVLTGNVARSKVYSRHLVDELRVVIDSDETMLAADGETFPGNGTFVVAKQKTRLRTYSPRS